ncbi:MAG: hypothetical protein EPO26_18605 [Chloroflexota bacterium]|nr:MAG: hypothetical protein EPO26_18605 [Chloroflexota bacterium]
MTDEVEDIALFHPSPWRIDGEVRIGSVRLPPEVVTETLVYRYEEGPIIRRSATVQVDLRDWSRVPAWDQRAEVVLSRSGDRVFTGMVERAEFLSEDRMLLTLHDSTRYWEHVRLGTAVAIGLTTRELMQILLRFLGRESDQIVGLDVERRQRPFVFAVPIDNALWTLPEPAPRLYRIGDLFIVAHDDSQFLGLNDILAPDGQRFADAYPVWKNDTPRIVGAVVAEGFFEARIAALRRARVALDIVSAGIRLTQSKIEDDHSAAFPGWDFGFWRARPRLSEWMYLRDEACKTPKVLVMQPHFDPLGAPFDLAEAERLNVTTALLGPVAAVGGLRPKDLTPLPQAVRELLETCERVVHWLSIARAETVPRDELLACWFALETLVGTESYPNLFSEPNNTPIIGAIQQFLQDLEIPVDATLTKDFLSNKLLRGDPIFLDRVRIFAQRNGVGLRADEERLLRSINRRRGGFVHGAARAEPTAVELAELEHIVEKLFFAKLSRLGPEADAPLFPGLDPR